MNPINNVSSHETFKLEKIQKKQSSVIARIVKELKRPIGTYLGKIFAKVTITSDDKLKKQELIKKGKGVGLKLEIEKKHTLDGFQLLNSNSKKWIVVFNGMKASYESSLNALEGLSEDVGANVLAFNYRGVGDSTGKPTSIKDWVEDGQYVLKYLEEKGVLPEDIVIYGHSMGGGIASEVYKKQEKKPGLFLEASPHCLAKAIQAKRGGIAGIAAKYFNWNFNSHKVINGDSTAKIALLVNRRDPTVRYHKSLYKKLVKNGDGKIQRIKIGEKQEEFGKISVKSGVKDFAKEKSPKDKKELSEAAKTYKKKYEALKKDKVIKHLPHPHARVMDRRLAQGIEDEKLQPFQEKFKKEDDIAYEKMVTIFKEFLNI